MFAKLFYKDLPPCPGDPGDYLIVTTKEGRYWRRKRGLVQPARLNEAYADSALAMRLSAPAASTIVHKLLPYTRGLDTGRLHARISGGLRKSLLQQSRASYCFLMDMEVQPRYPLGALLKAPFQLQHAAHEIALRLPVSAYCVKAQNSLASHFFAELIMLWGDPLAESGLRCESTASPLYRIGQEYSVCTLSLPLFLQGPWMAMLKVSCMEGNELGRHPKHYGMKVVEVGG